MGAGVLGLAQSSWLLSFSVTVFFSLPLAKRHGEVLSAVQTNKPIAGRGYEGNDWPLTLAFGSSSGFASITIMLLYVTNEATVSGLYRQPAWLYAVPGLIFLWLARIWLLSHRSQLHEDPVIFTLTDRVSLILAALLIFVFILAI